ncbi:MAG: rhomboid family intramembrane serine protease [Candidatus Hodarchaeota archaeon]
MFVLDSNNFKKARITLTLIFLNIIFFFTINTNIELFYLFVQINGRIFNNLEYWRIITAMFIHGDLLHLFSNMFGLLLFGTFVETSLSKFNYILAYFFSGLLGNIFSLFLLSSTIISLGASGAIFGLMGVSFVIIAMQEDKSLLFLGVIYLILFLVSSLSPDINIYAHIFGLIGGIAFGYLFYKKNQFKTSI